MTGIFIFTFYLSILLAASTVAVLVAKQLYRLAKWLEVRIGSVAYTVVPIVGICVFLAGYFTVLHVAGFTQR